MSEKKERQEWAKDELRKLVKPGDKVKTILRHTTRSGMSRSVSVIIGAEDETYLVGLALGDKIDGVHGGVKVAGCGMDAGFSLVYDLSQTLFPTYTCTGDCTDSDWHRCASPDHVNGPRNGEPDTRRDYSPEREHKDGYALSQAWL